MPHFFGLSQRPSEFQFRTASSSLQAGGHTQIVGNSSMSAFNGAQNIKCMADVAQDAAHSAARQAKKGMEKDFSYMYIHLRLHGKAEASVGSRNSMCMPQYRRSQKGRGAVHFSMYTPASSHVSTVYKGVVFGIYCCRPQVATIPLNTQGAAKAPPSHSSQQLDCRTISDCYLCVKRNSVLPIMHHWSQYVPIFDKKIYMFCTFFRLVSNFWLPGDPWVT